MKKAIFPGTFDPITFGHLDIIKRSLNAFDSLTVLFLINNKKSTLFELDDRLKFAKKALKGYKNIEVDSFDGLLTEYCAKNNNYNVIRGIRNGVDYEYEMQYFGINRILDEKIEMFFLPTTKEKLYISSGNVRELLHHKRSVDGLVPAEVIAEINKSQQKK